MDHYRPVIDWPYRRHNHQDAMEDLRFWGVVSTDGFYPLEHGKDWHHRQRFRQLRSVRHWNERGTMRSRRQQLKPYDGRAYQYAEFWPRSWACFGYFQQSACDYVQRLKSSTKRKAPTFNGS